MVGLLTILLCDRLMEKDYMERTEGNNYAYVA
jgi:hypothetical protein